jgi:hypothetical protein
MTMRAAHWRYLVLDNGLGAACLNAVINGAIAWATFRGTAVVPLWGPLGIASDTVATSLILPFLTCVIVTALTRWHVRAGRLPPLPVGLGWAGLPSGTLARGGALAAASFVLLVPITLLIFIGSGVRELPFERFVVFKVAFAVADGLLVTPLCARLALAGVQMPKLA